jgi:hypothetical protein
MPPMYIRLGYALLGEHQPAKEEGRLCRRRQTAFEQHRQAARESRRVGQ